MASKSKVTIKDVAKAANVSVATISYVINNVENMVSDETRKKVLKVIEELGYVPNITARSLVKNESRLIGVILPSKGYLKYLVLRENPFYLEFISGVEYKALEHGYNTLLIGVDNEKECKDILNARNFAGLIAFDFIDKNYLKILQEADIPIIVVDDKRNENNKLSYLNTDNELGGFLAAEYLVNKGHKNIGYLTFGHETDWMERYLGSREEITSPVSKQRFSGYERAHAKYGLEVNENNILFYGAMDKIVEHIKTERITSVFCVSDVMAMHLIKGLYSHGVKVPNEVSIIGFDDIAFCAFLLPSLTTVKQDIFGKGSKAVEIILNNISHPNDAIKEFIIPVNLVERESVKEIK